MPWPTSLESIAIAQAVVTTLGTVLVVGLAFLPHPSRATLLWSIGFLVATVSVVLAVMATIGDAEPLRRVTLAGLLSCSFFAWSGLRAWRGARSLAWLYAPTLVALVLILVVPGDTRWFSVAFRVAFLVSAVFPALTAWDLWRMPERRDLLLQPLLITSASYAVFAVAGAVAGVFYPPTDGDDLALVRTLNALGMLIYVICLAVSIVWLSQQRRPSAARPPIAEWTRFRDVARDRLARAEAADEEAWALLVIRLDDEANVRAAAGNLSYAHITAEIDAHVRRIFPADADIGRQAAGRIVVLVPRSTVVIRELVRRLLTAISGYDGPYQTMLQNSASVGWVSVDVGGYDFSALLGAATMAVERAESAGGDRWYRVSSADLD